MRVVIDERAKVVGARLEMLAGRCNVVRRGQSLKTSSPNAVTPSGSVTDSKASHPKKTRSPMDLTVEGRSMVLRARQPVKALCSIAVTGNPPRHSGIVIAPWVVSGIANLLITASPCTI